jgi:hypothetical protein
MIDLEIEKKVFQNVSYEEIKGFIEKLVNKKDGKLFVDFEEYE